MSECSYTCIYTLVPPPCTCSNLFDSFLPSIIDGIVMYVDSVDTKYTQNSLITVRIDLSIHGLGSQGRLSMYAVHYSLFLSR